MAVCVHMSVCLAAIARIPATLRQPPLARTRGVGQSNGPHTGATVAHERQDAAKGARNVRRSPHTAWIRVHARGLASTARSKSGAAPTTTARPPSRSRRSAAAKSRKWAGVVARISRHVACRSSSRTPSRWRTSRLGAPQGAMSRAVQSTPGGGGEKPQSQT